MNVIYRIMLAAISALHLQAAIFEFTLDLQSSSTTARGKSLYEVDPGSYPPIVLDTGNHTLRLPVGWGSDFLPGNTDLSSDFLTASIIKGVGIAGTELYEVANRSPTSGNYTPTALGVSGFFDRTISLDGSHGFPVDQQEASLLNREWHLSIRSVDHQEGELIGFIVPVPEPSFCTLAIALSLLTYTTVRKRASALQSR